MLIAQGKRGVVSSKFSRKCRGFSLIELLITLIIVSISLTGIFLLQLKAHSQLTEASQRYMAEKFMGSLLTEITTSKYAWYADDKLKSNSPFFKNKGQDFPQVSNECKPTTKDATVLAEAFLDCWASQITKNMAVDEALLKDQYTICQSKDGLSCSADGSLVLVQMAWYSKDCQNVGEGVQTDIGINNCVVDSSSKKLGARLYRVAIQP